MTNDPLQVGTHVIVIDAGGGTIDVSGYAVEGENPLHVEEIFAPECAFTPLFHTSLSNARLQAAYLALPP